MPMYMDERLICDLLKQVEIASPSPDDPVAVGYVPAPWELVGTGNYAAVFAHPDHPDVVVKVYAPDRPGIEREKEVYRKLGESAYFPVCYQEGDNYLVIKRMRGIPLFDCFRYGIPVPPKVIEDVDRALAEVRAKGLYPQDVHAKNVLMYQGRGYLIDVSDYGEDRADTKWRDLRAAYYRFYLPFWKDRRWKVPLWVLNGVRKGYRYYQKGMRLGRKRSQRQPVASVVTPDRVWYNSVGFESGWKQRRTFGLIYYLISAAVAGLDQLTKYLVVRSMELGESIPVWPGVFHLTSHRNAGAAFGILQNQRLLFIVITIAVAVGIGVVLARLGNRQPRTSAALALVLGGAVGNFIDRVRIGEVVDFLDVKLIHFPIFNLADAAITIGVALLLLDAFFESRRAG